MKLTNDVAELNGVVRLTSADVTLDTDGRDCSFKKRLCRLVEFKGHGPNLKSRDESADTELNGQNVSGWWGAGDGAVTEYKH